MLTWTTLGTVAGAVLVVHALAELIRREWPNLSPMPVVLGAAEALEWAYGWVTTCWSLTHALLWTSNGIIVAAAALGGLFSSQYLSTSHSSLRTSQPPNTSPTA